jgi:subtilisin family serine protease
VDEIPGGFALVPELIVAFHRPSQAQAILEHIGGKLVDELGPGTWSVDLTGNRGAVAAARWLNRRPQIDYAELNLKFQTEAIPNDPFFSTQWSLHQANDVDINLPEAWSITTGSATTLIAVIDSGIDYNHPDLASHIYVNPREVASNGRDDDGNGYIDDTRGWNFVDRNANATDDNGHGTHVAGIVAATTNNAVGMAGVNQQAQILPLKFIDRWGAGSIGDAVAAIRYAVHQGARVLNASWATPTRSRALNEVIAWAGSRGAVFVTAAGNEGVNNALVRSYPAMDRHSNTLSVAAIEPSGRLAPWSNFGATTVDLAAPGASVLSTTPGGGHASWSGSSMAAPHVAGVVSLILARHPEYSASQLVARVRTTVKPLATLRNRVITGGMVDAARAVDDAAPLTWRPRPAAARARPRGR